MAYKIAVATSDGSHIDWSFGAALAFEIYEVEGTDYRQVELRKCLQPQDTDLAQQGISAGCDESKDGCGNGGCGSGGGCGGGGAVAPKVQLVSDCRCVICKKIGFQVQKQLEKLAISAFDVECGVLEALDKITAYLDKIDNHQSLRGLQREGKE